MPVTQKDFDSLRQPEKIALILGPVLIAISAWLHVMLPAESDKGWLLHVARVWLEGRTLYRDIMEVNPPLIIWFYALPSWIASHVGGLKDYAALGIIGLLGSGLSIAVSTRLIRFHPAFAGNALRQAEFAVLLGLVFIFYNTELYFFDRDHLFFVFTFPYVLRCMPSLSEEKLSLRFRLLIGCMAALGFCIKPHTIIVFTAIQCFTVLRRWSPRALLTVENYVVVSCGLFYLAAIFCFHPAYITTVLPIALATYSDFGNWGSGYVFLPPLVISMGLVFADFRPWYVTPYRRDVYYFLSLCAALTVYATVQNGWGYTYNPLSCIVLFITGWMWWEYDWLVRQHKERRLPLYNIFFGMRGCVLVFLMHGAYIAVYIYAMSATLSSVEGPCAGSPLCWRSVPYVKYVQNHQVHSFGSLSLDFSKWVLLMRLPDMHWDTRYNHLWMLPTVLRYGEPSIQKYRWVLDFVGKSLADDLNRRKPEIVFVDTSPGFMGIVRRFDYAALLSRVPEFKDAWTHYHYDTSFDICQSPSNGASTECKYDIYTRVP